MCIQLCMLVRMYINIDNHADCDITQPNIKLFISRSKCVSDVKGMHHN